MDRGRRRKIADIAEKLGVGFTLGVVAQGIFLEQPSLTALGLSLGVLIISATLLVVSVYLASEG